MFRSRLSPPLPAPATYFDATVLYQRLHPTVAEYDVIPLKPGFAWDELAVATVAFVMRAPV